jgi:hypothetical protein
MLEESLRGEAVSMKHTFLLDKCLPTYSAAQRDVSPLPPFSSVPFTDARSLPRIPHTPAFSIFSPGLIDQARARRDFFSNSEGIS